MSFEIHLSYDIFFMLHVRQCRDLRFKMFPTCGGTEIYDFEGG